MVETIAENLPQRQELERLLAERREPEAVVNRRREALARFEALRLPTTRQEPWRFTDISPLAGIEFVRAADSELDPALLPPVVGPSSNRLVFVNGRFAPGLSRFGADPGQALLGGLSQALLTHPERVAEVLETIPGQEEHYFAAINAVLWEDGAIVHLPRGKMLEDPIHLIFYATGPDTVNYPRIQLQLEDGAQATVVEEYLGDGRSLTCPVTEVVLGQEAVLDYHKFQTEATEAWHLGAFRTRLGRNAQLQGHFATTGGHRVRTDILALVDGEGAHCDLRGLNLTEANQLGDYHVRVEHLRPHCTSQQLFKGVLDGKSRTVFDGTIYVAPHAQQIDARQNNRNLLLSRHALANSNPRLEILADDVKCSHGSTIGFLDPDQLFYLRSRGIGERQARAMLVYAFAGESIEDIRLEPLRERLERLLIGRLYPEILTGEIS